MKQIFDGTYYKLGLHIHTTRSDGRPTPEQAVAIYRAQGYDAIALTDHWCYGDNGEIDGMPILSGIEYDMGGKDTANGVAHILAVGMERDPRVTATNDWQKVVDAINAADGIAVLAHPNWSLNTPEQALALHGVLATEVYGAVSEAHESLRGYSDYFIDLCANQGLYYHLWATDDAHYYDGSDQCKGWMMVKAQDCTREALVQALRAGDCYASQGPDLHVERQGDELKIQCSPCSIIAVHSNYAWRSGRTLRGEGLTEMRYKLMDERWARVEVVDKEGKKAWSNFVNL